MKLSFPTLVIAWVVFTLVHSDPLPFTCCDADLCETFWPDECPEQAGPDYLFQCCDASCETLWRKDCPAQALPAFVRPAPGEPAGTTILPFFCCTASCDTLWPDDCEEQVAPVTIFSCCNATCVTLWPDDCPEQPEPATLRLVFPDNNADTMMPSGAAEVAVTLPAAAAAGLVLVAWFI